MGILYRIADKITGESIGDFLIDSNDAVWADTTIGTTGTKDKKYTN